MLRLTLIILCLSIILTSCGSNTTPAGNVKTIANPSDSIVKSDTISVATSSERAADLIVGNDCRNCHREREKLIGPAFSEIARKYNLSDVDSLAAKVIRGGSGHWGQTAMAPHPALSLDDAKEIVKFILRFR